MLAQLKQLYWQPWNSLLCGCAVEIAPGFFWNTNATIVKFSSTTTTPCMMLPNGKQAKRHLAVFDFDHTTVDDNTDTVVRDLLDPKLTQPLRELAKSEGWTAYMAEIFRLIHANGMGQAEICEAIRNIPEVPGLKRLWKTLVEGHNMELIIISDSNSVFIAEWLQGHGLSELVTEVLTNPAHFDANGLLCIREFSGQTKCEICPRNLCKGDALEGFIRQQQEQRQIEYDRVIYIGDGSNDICPVLGLNERGIACARNGYTMQKRIAADKDSLNIKAKKIIFWDDGHDLDKALREELQHA